MTDVQFEYTRRGHHLRNLEGPEFSQVMENRDLELEWYLRTLRGRIGELEQGGGPGPGPSTVAYLHTQGIAASVWNITHNLGWHPNVTVKDSGGSVVEGELIYVDVNTIQLLFSAAFSGVAYLS